MSKFFNLSISIYIVGFLTAFFLKNHFIELKPNLLSNDNKLFLNLSQWELFLLILKNNSLVYFINISGFLTFGLFTVLNTFYNGFVLGYLITTINRIFLDSAFFYKRIAPHSIEIIGIIISSTLGFYLTNYVFKNIFLNKKPKFNFKHFTSLFVLGFIIILIAAFLESYVSAH
ncbi:stage II sporulation protein M [Aquirufa aurantiipilula]